ncbi:MAG: AraC family transcriptional regulator [Clostridia bacterium]|nr:AraC family transcriptional regulator [Clostridia bacterium]
MLEKIYINKPVHTDLNMYRCGIEDCTPGHYWGPAVRDHFLVHYIIKGKGVFQTGNNSYELKAGQGFLICPNTATYYQADNKDPWRYSWVGFHGVKAETYLKRAGLTANTPVFTYDNDDFLKDCLSQMIASNNLGKGREIRMLGLLYVFLSQLIETLGSIHTYDNNENKKEIYIKKAVEYIAMNYSREISICELASYIGLDRSYLYSVFKEYLKVSPQEFLINFRIDKACDLMHNRILSIGDISRSVGYEDQLLFSKAFKKIKHVSPRDYRKSLCI